jgi:CRP-like cAMP-binding protein
MTGDAPAEARSRADNTHSLVKALESVPSLATCDERVLLCIVGDSVNLVWPAGRTVFEAGAPADALFILLSGQVRVLDGGGAETAVLGPGEYFGELSLLLGTAHTRTAETVEDTELMVVPKERFEALLSENPRLAASIRAKAQERLAANQGRSRID